MDDALLIRTADRNLRRRFQGTNGVPDITGLTAYADQMAQNVSDNPVTITGASGAGSSSTGQLMFPPRIWFIAAEELLADPKFNYTATPRTPRVILPDYRYCQP